MNGDQIEAIMAVKSRHEAELLNKAHVLSVGIGFRERAGQLTDEVVLVVNVDQKYPATKLSSADLIPSCIDGIAVDVREVGRLQAQ
jgi:hypothetical protein